MKLLNLYISTFSLLGQSSLDTSVYLEQIRHLENKDETVLPTLSHNFDKGYYINECFSKKDHPLFDPFLRDLWLHGSSSMGRSHA